MKDKLSIWWKFCLLTLLLVLAPPEIMAQGLTIKGQVLDSNNEPIIGASIVEKGNTSNGTITDFDGNFSFKISGKGKTIVITYIGYQTQELTVTSGKALKVIMKEDAQAMDEVVVIGYTSKARKDLTGSVGSVSGVKIAAIPVSSAAVALQGKIAGVQVTTVDGAPGADINIRVRGGTSVTQSNEPLYIVDGFQVDNINDIPPTDIASIDVLKDASITAIYGAKGGNGVVVVTTKSAKAGKIQVSLNAHLSTSQLAKKLDLMNAAEFARYQYEWSACNGSRSSNAKFFRANFGNPQDLDMYNTLPTHDWQDEVMGENPINYSTNVSIGGGTEKMRFNASLTQSEDKGIIMGSGVRRTNLNIKTAIDITKNLTLQINPKLSFRRDEGAGGDNIGTGGIIDVLRYRPTNGLREFGYIDPSYADPDEEALFTYTNPKSDISINQQKKYSYNYTNAFSLEWKPIKGLVLRSEATIGLTWKDQYRFYGALTSEGQKNNSQPVANIQKDYTFKYIWTNTASYGFTLKNVHNISLLLGQEIYHSQNTKNVQKNRYFPRAFEADQAWANMGFGTPQESYTQLSTPDRTASFFGQASYNYNHKYLLSLTMRADGSTKFAPGNQWGYFPSISGAWVLSEENFLNDVEWIDQLKLRAAVGLAGNNRIDNDMWRYLYSVNSTGGPGFGESTQFGEQWYGNQGSTTFANKDIKWETTLTRNLAADITLFGGRLTVTPEVYWNTTKDLLYKSDIPSSVGYISQMQNIGQVTNKGIELSISGDILRGRDYVLSANLSLGMNKMKVDKLNGTDNVIWDQNNRWKSSYNDYCLKVGDQVGLIYGFVYDGLYSMDEFYFDPTNNLQALPWGSTAAENGTSKDAPLVDENGVEHPKTVINEVSGNSNSGIATLPGKIKFKDLNGDGKIDGTDKTYIGNPSVPQIIYGFGASMQYKGWDASFFFQGVAKRDIMLQGIHSFTGNTHNLMQWVVDNYWREDGANPSAEYPRLTNGSNPNTTEPSTYWLKDGSYIRLKNVELGYTWKFLRAYVAGANLLTFSKFKIWDPELNTQNGQAYPTQRTVSVGLQMTF